MLPNYTKSNINTIFNGCVEIYVPSAVYNQYMSADNWSGQSSKIRSY